MFKNLKNRVVKFVNSKKDYPLIIAIAAGLYPLLYCYNANFTLLDSWKQFFYYVLLYLVLPIIIVFLVAFLVSKINFFKRNKTYAFSLLNSIIFSLLIAFSTIGFYSKLKILLVFVIAIIVGVILHKLLKKVIVIQLILALITAPKLIPDIYKYMSYSKAWIQQPDAIEKVVFNKKPNIYVIQPDGYANFSDLETGYYNFNANSIKRYLSNNGFKNYPKFRSNYFSTLSSNASMFTMKHHYYNHPKPGQTEVLKSRDIIVGKNPVLSIFKNNGYKTNLLLEQSYLLVNRPEIYYDYCNISYQDVSPFSRGFDIKRDLFQDLKKAIKQNESTNSFYFIEKISPGHVPSIKSEKTNAKKERIKYLQRLEDTNAWLKNTIDLILSEDTNALIVIVADHGGYVGFNYTMESKKPVRDPKLVKSIFTANLCIKWPKSYKNNYDDLFKTNVNLFRILFTYLSDNETLLNSLQDDKSYIVLDEEIAFGTYEYINETGEVVLNKIEN